VQQAVHLTQPQRQEVLELQPTVCVVRLSLLVAYPAAQQEQAAGGVDHLTVQAGVVETSLAVVVVDGAEMVETLHPVAAAACGMVAVDFQMLAVVAAALCVPDRQFWELRQSLERGVQGRQNQSA
jgi:hypothetical protein